MDDTISRQAAIDTFDGTKVDEEDCTEYDIGYNDGIDFAVSKLSVLPSAEPEITEEDVKKYCRERYLAIVDGEKARWPQPEIIRCGGCKYRRDQSETTAWLPCRALIVPDDFSCIRAERREEWAD